MKQFFLFLLFILTIKTTTAQKLIIENKTDCELTIVIKAHEPGASCVYSQSGPRFLPPGNMFVLDHFGSSPFAGTYIFAPTPPGLVAIWDAVKFGFTGDGECFAGDDIGDPACGFSTTWSSGECLCKNKIVQAVWTFVGADIFVTFY